MRVFVQYEPNKTGKGLFLQRLEKAIAKYGVEFEYDNYKGCDLTLSFTHWRKESGKLPKVLRLDGVHMVAGKRVGWRNGQISKAIKDADLAIWQSEFCYDIVGGMLGRPKKNAIILNGMDPAEYNNVVPIESKYPRNIVACAKWDYKNKTPRKHKRLKDTAKIARDYTEKDHHTCFWIIGNVNRKYYEFERVRYTGWLDQAEMRRYFKMADCFVYVPYFDWCPNAVVEMHSAGLWGIVSNNGGQQEIIGGYGGVMVRVDKRMTHELLKSDNVPHVDSDKVLQMISDFYHEQYMRDFEYNPQVHIDYVAQQYRSAFEEVL